MDLRQSPVEAFRDELAGKPWRPPTEAEATGIAVAELLRAATIEPSPDERERLIRVASDLAKTCRLAEHPAEGCWEDPIGVVTPISSLRELAILLYQRNSASSLAGHILESLTLLLPRDEIESARVGITAINHAIFAGRLDLAADRIRTLIGRGHRLRSDAVLARAWVTAGFLAQLRGNIPRAEVAARRANKYALRLGDPRTLGLVTAFRGSLSGLRGDYEQSVELLWRAFNLSDVPSSRTGMLNNLGETLYRVGHFRAARAARAIALQRGMTLGATIISLGGYAVCSAALEDERGVRWATQRATELANESYEPGIAQGLLGCADACGAIGLDDLARTLYQRGIRMADAAGYHDLRFRPDPTVKRLQHPRSREFIGAGARASRSVLELAPDGVPDQLELTVR